MRTLILSDFHLGQRPGHDVLRRAPALAALLARLDDVERLVLLGDIVELQSRLAGRRAMEVGAPILRAIGARLPREAEIVYVPGNHDAITVRAWLRGRGHQLGLADSVPPDASPELTAVLAALGAGRRRVRVSYPGVWLRDGVWATHGHYLDRHLRPETTFGLLRDRPAAALRDTARPDDYERARRRTRRHEREGVWARVRERPLAMLLEVLAELTRYGTGLLRQLHLTDLTTRLIDLQMRRAALPAMAVVARRLGVDAETVIFGHVHRRGPLPGDAWHPRAAEATHLLNTGSWVYEPLLLDDEAPPHPYWPGGAVWLADDEPPRAVGLLDGLTRGELIGRPGRSR